MHPTTEPNQHAAGSSRSSPLAVLMFHRIGDGIGCTNAAQLDAFFARLVARYNCVLPGEPLAADRLNVCVSFDDAYYCFYRTVWPLLRKHRLRAVLAVSAELTPETVDLSAAERLAAPGRSRTPELVTSGLCTWSELNEIVSSGVAMIAAHGATHARLDAPDSDLTREILGSGRLLERRLGVPIECFVFPHGRYSAASLRCSLETYRYAMRIGQASNRSWSPPLLYRVGADGADLSRFFSPGHLWRLRVSGWWNRVRGN